MKKPLWPGPYTPLALDRWTHLADAWSAEGLFTRAERDRVVAAAVGADLRR